MLFSSIPFLYCFLPAVVLVYFLVPRSWKNAVLLLFSLLFYAWGEPKYVFLMLATIALFYGCGLAIGKARQQCWKKFWLLLSVVVGIGLLGVFKYADFFVENFNAVTGLNVGLLRLALPVGISFYTFQSLSYVIDVYRGNVPMQKNPISFGAYVALFPQLIAGPIVRYADIARELDSRATTWEDASCGVRRFLVGLGKKILLANQLGQLTAVFRASGEKSVLFCWMYAIAFTLQIYFDFSGYSDMAIGMGKIFGFEYKENFNYPYISKSATEFWRRWHISLGSFFRDYVYIPLGGNRCSTGRVIFNLAVVWALTGLWHGASWNFVIWGVYYGVLLIIEKFVLSDVLKRTPGLIRRIVTLFLIVIGWTVFYYTDMPQMIKHLGAMFSIGASGLTDPVTMAVLRKYTVFPIVAMIASTPVLPKVCGAFTSLCRNKTVNEVLSLAYLSVLLYLSMIFMVGQSYNPFIYAYLSFRCPTLSTMGTIRLFIFVSELEVINNE